MFLSLSARWILRIHSDSGTFCFQGFLIFFVSHFDICTRFTPWFDVITNGCYISIQNFRWTYECVALPSSFPTADSSSQDNDQHRSHYWSLLISLLGWKNVVFQKDWNEFVLSMPIHQFLKMNSHSLTNFAVNRNHVSTIISRVEILSSFARDLCSMHNTLCTPVSLPLRDLGNPFSSYRIRSPLAVR